jgi:hypothetical protein
MTKEIFDALSPAEQTRAQLDGTYQMDPAEMYAAINNSQGEPDAVTDTPVDTPATDGGQTQDAIEAALRQRAIDLFGTDDFERIKTDAKIGRSVSQPGVREIVNRFSSNESFDDLLYIQSKKFDNATPEDLIYRQWVETEGLEVEDKFKRRSFELYMDSRFGAKPSDYELEDEEDEDIQFAVSERNRKLNKVAQELRGQYLDKYEKLFSTDVKADPELERKAQAEIDNFFAGYGGVTLTATVGNETKNVFELKPQAGSEDDVFLRRAIADPVGTITEMFTKGTDQGEVFLASDFSDMLLMYRNRSRIAEQLRQAGLAEGRKTAGENIKNALQPGLNLETLAGQNRGGGDGVPSIKDQFAALRAGGLNI